MNENSNYRQVYLDHSATTPVDERVLNEMLPYFSDKFGNANSIHGFGSEAALAVDTARRKIAKLIDAKHTEIYFTSGGTEADNWALKGVAFARRDRGKHIITSSIEHAAIMASCKQLEAQGYELTYLSVNEKGLVSPAELKKALRSDTILVSVMLANNEVGTVQPVKELCEITHEAGVLFHTDAVQAMGSIPVSVKDLGVDMLTFSAHKFYGPKGVGALYIKGGVKPDKVVVGGHQERTMRGGTTNVPCVAGMAKALELAVENLDENAKHIKSLRDYFVSEVEKKIPHVIYNGDREKRLPQNANFSFEFIEGESRFFNKDQLGKSCLWGW